MTVPHSPLADIVGRWPVAFLDDIHAYLESLQSGGAYANQIVNGGFDVAQIGTGPFTATGYTVDMWRQTVGGGATVSTVRNPFALGQIAVPGEPAYYLTFDRTVVGAAASQLATRIEDVRTFAGQTFSVSIWLLASVACNVELIATQNFGSGGAPSGAVTTTLATFAATPIWTEFTFTGTLPSIAGKTLGTTQNSSYLELALSLPVAAGVVTLSFSKVDARLGNTPGPFAEWPLGYTLERCQRYFQKTFPAAVVPAQNAGGSGALQVLSGIAGAASRQASAPWMLPVTMRDVPVVTTYNPNAANAQARDTSFSVDCSGTSATPSIQIINFAYTGNAATTAQSTIVLHMTADARL